MKKYFQLLFLLMIVTVLACTQEKPGNESQSSETQEQAADNTAQQDDSKQAGDDNKEEKPTQSKIDEFANTSLQKMFDFIANTQKLKVNVASTFDVLQRNGQLIEFGGNTEWIIRRPDHVLIDSLSWEGDDRIFYFDGKDITYYDSGHNVYAIAPKAGDLDQAFDYFVGKLNMPLPLTELFSVKHPFDLNTAVSSSKYLGEAILNGVDCDEFTFRFPDTDLQIWIKAGDQPLPQRVVITYKDSPGQPQYKAQFSDWDLSSVLPDKLFKFVPPKDSRKIIFAAGSRNTGNSAGKSEGETDK